MGPIPSLDADMAPNILVGKPTPHSSGYIFQFYHLFFSTKYSLPYKKENKNKEKWAVGSKR